MTGRTKRGTGDLAPSVVFATPKTANRGSRITSPMTATWTESAGELTGDASFCELLNGATVHNVVVASAVTVKAASLQAQRPAWRAANDR